MNLDLKRNVVRSLDIVVTSEDIANGRLCSQEECPIALAATRATGSACVVWARTVQVLGHPVRYWWLPARAQSFIEAFDAQRPVTPFRFTLRPGGRVPV